MADQKNFFMRAVEAMVAGRERSAQRYVARFERQLGERNGPVTKR